MGVVSFGDMTGFELPVAPGHLKNKVKAWSQPVVIPTYLPDKPDKNPMFLEKRVYQGSSGKVYPLPVIDRINELPTRHPWQAVHIENDWLRVMILPEIGGRIHLAIDKTNGYDLFYRQNVIKPALVGLTGPWISGGVEINWPQHHRPSTFMPADFAIENHDDGSVTVWCGEHDPMNRTKGMHGICLHPDRAVIELKARLYNRSELVQTFLWWANVGVHSHELYQSFFPPDVHFVADHARRAMSTFPLCQDQYYGVEYGKRAREGVPANEQPARFPPDLARCRPNDLSWYANIPVPTSYMAMNSQHDFLGGYDHARQAGLVFVANHHIAPGKKQWTWGNHDFGYAWDRNLTDEDGPYIELMTGVYTDNQPDFSFMHPGETRTWSQYWYPIQRIGPVQQANVDAAIAVNVLGESLNVGIAVTRRFADATIHISQSGKTIAELKRNLIPGQPWLNRFNCEADGDLCVRILAEDREILRYESPKPAPAEMPEPAVEPAMPADVESIEQLYLIGKHLEQYRHATRSPEAYWREALRREPGNAQCSNAMGLWHYRRGEFEEAKTHFQTAIKTLTRYNANPYDGEAFYNLGLTLLRLNRLLEAYSKLYKATWNRAWQAPAFFVLAQLDCRARRFDLALQHLDAALHADSRHSQSRNLKAAVLQKLGQLADAQFMIEQTLHADPLDWWATHLGGRELQCDTQVRLDLAWEYANAGLFTEAIDLLNQAEPEHGSGTLPLVQYTLGFFYEQSGQADLARTARRGGQAASVDYCFPARLEEIAVLQSAIYADANDARARYLLANLYYDRRRHEQAIALWESSVRLDESNSVAWRNLGIGAFNIRHDARAAKDAFEKAFKANPRDARLLYERDQLKKRLSEPPAERLADLLEHADLVRRRDDLTIELCALFNQTGASDRALSIIESRRFQPWEGGEGLALAQYVRTHLLLGQQELRQGLSDPARTHFELALQPPETLGEAKHLLVNQSDIRYWLAVALSTSGKSEAAREQMLIAAESSGNFQEMAVKPISEMTFYSVLALRALHRTDEAAALAVQLAAYAAELRAAPVRVDYFATSLPTMLLFDDDLTPRRDAHADFLEAQLKLLGADEQAARRLLEQILVRYPDHALASDLLSLIAQNLYGF